LLFLAGELAHQLAVGIEEAKLHLATGLALEPVVDDDTRGRILAGVWRSAEATAAGVAIGLPGREERDVLLRHLAGEGAHDVEIAEDVESAALRGHDHIVFP